MAALQLSTLPRKSMVQEQTSEFEYDARLLCAYGTNSLAFFGSAPENLRFVTPDGTGLVYYRLVHHVAIVLGDPISLPCYAEDVTRSFLQFCETQHWHVAFYQASSEFLDLYSELKLHAFKMGEEACLSPQEFSLNGSAIANVRTSARRAERDGVTISWYEGVLPVTVMKQIKHVSQLWLTQRAGTYAEETGFSTGKIDNLVASAIRADEVCYQAEQSTITTRQQVPRVVTAVATTREGTPCAFVTWTPLYGHQSTYVVQQKGVSVQNGWGWSLDLLRRVPDASPGVMELLLVKALERFRLSGAQRLSLGLIALSDTHQEMSTTERQLLTFAINRLHLLEKRDTLFFFKQKFHPGWESRYLVTPKILSLPLVALAISNLRNYAHS